MDSMRVWLFGELRIEIDGLLVPALATHKAKSLFAYFLIHRPRSLSRDTLVATFWSDHAGPDARKLLRNEIWRIRSTVDRRLPETESCLVARADTIGINPALDVWLDVEAFNELASDTDDVLDEHLRKAVDLYQGPLLEACYDEWCLFEREVLEDRYLGVLQRLLRIHARRARWEQAIACAKRLLSVDALREDAHRDLMECYYRSGNRAAALRQYEICRRVLRDELGVEPMPETAALAMAIKGNRPLDGEPMRLEARRLDTSAAGGGADVGRMLAALQIARQGIQEMDRMLKEIEDVKAASPRLTGCAEM